MQRPEISDTAVSNVVRLADGARKTRVLYVGDADFAKAQFASVAPQLQLIPGQPILAVGASAAVAAADTPDVALIDCGAPGVDARAVIAAIRARHLDIPIVLALDPGGSEHAPTKVTAELHVDDYTVKLPGWLARLTSRLEFAIAHHRRRRSLESLQASAERLRTVVESAPVCLARVARDGTILAMNDAAMKMVSAAGPEDVLGKSLFSLVEPGAEDEVRRFVDAVSGGHPGSLEFATSTAAGSARVVDTRAVPLSTDAEGRASALLVLRDATERKRLEDSMLAAATPSQPLRRDSEREIEAIRQQLEGALEESRRLEAEREALRAEADEARARAAMIEHVRAACSAAEHQLGQSQTAYRQLASERDALATELAGIRAHHDAALAQHVVEREQHQERLRALEVERAHYASRCDALDALVASLETRHAAECEEHRATRQQLDAEVRRRQESNPLAAERDGLLASMAALRTQFDELSGSLDAAEARHAAEILEQRAAAAAAESRVRDQEQARTQLSRERDELRAAVDRERQRVEQLQAALAESRTGGDARIAERDAAHRILEEQIEELRGRVSEALGERDAIRQEMRAAVDRAEGKSQQLQAAIDEVQAARHRQAGDSERVRRELLQQVEELQRRIQAGAAERDAMQQEMGSALKAAETRAAQLQRALDDVRSGRESQAAEGDAARQALAERVEELQIRADAAVAERDAVRREMTDALDAAGARSADLEAALVRARADLEATSAEVDHADRSLTHRIEELHTRLDEAIADRERLQQRLDEQESSYARISTEYADLKARVEREAATAAEPPAPAAPDDEVALTGLLDAKVAFREAFQILSGELQSAVETARAQHAALLRAQPASYDALEERLRQAEAECRRLAAERDERDTTARALQAEVEQLIEIRREQRKELVRALQESDETERRAAARLAECARLRQMLAEAQAALQRLSKWAANQGARLGAATVADQTDLSRIDPSGRPGGREEDTSAPPLEASWS